jgi:hypothetical protein
MNDTNYCVVHSELEDCDSGTLGSSDYATDQILEPHNSGSEGLLEDNSNISSYEFFPDWSMTDEQLEEPYDCFTPLRDLQQQAHFNSIVCHCDQEECKVFSFIEWRERRTFSDAGFHPYFERYLLNVCQGVKCALSVVNMLSLEEMAHFKDGLRKLTYSKYAAALEEEEIKFLRQETRIALYWVRANLFSMEVPEYQSEGILDSFFNADIGVNISNVLEKGADGFKDFADCVQNVIHAVFQPVEKLLSVVLDKADNMIESLRLKVVEYIVKRVIPQVSLHRALFEDASTRKIALTIITFISFACLGTMGFVAGGLVWTAFRVLIPGLNGLMVAESEHPYSSVTLFMAFVVGVLGLGVADADVIRKRCVYLTSLFAGGTVLANVFATLVSFMPVALRHALVLRFGSQASKEAILLEQWKTEVQTILAVSRVTSILGTDYYKTKVQEKIQEGLQMVPLLTDTSVKNTFLSFYCKLLNVSAMLTQKMFNDGARKYPFCVHFSGPPGIGKTLISNRFCSDVFGAKRDEIYERPISDRFWSGFLGHKYVKIDEFLCGPLEIRQERAREFLSLVSTAQFMPEMASVDNPAVGLKGTTVLPEAVVTINNSPYDRVPTIDTDALQRRRQFVIVVEKSLKWHGSNNTLDMTKYNDEQIAQVVWAKFAILPPQYDHSLQKKDYVWVDYRTLCELVKEKYQAHLEMCERIQTIHEGCVVDDISPEQVFRDTMKANFGVPKNVSSLWDSLATFVAPTVVAQGPGKCVHYCKSARCSKFDKRIRHVPRKGTWQCRNCFCEQECISDSDSYQSAESDWWRPTQTASSRWDYQQGLATSFFNGATGTVLPTFWEHTVSAVQPYLIYGVGMATLMWAVRKMFSGNKEELTYGAETAARRGKYEKKSSRSYRHQRGIQAEGPVDVPSGQIFVNGRCINVVPLFDHWVLTYTHGITSVLGEDGSINETVFVSGSKRYLFEFKMENVMSFPDDDICFINLDSNMIPKFRDIRKRFLHPAEIGTISQIDTMFKTDKGTFYPKASKHYNQTYMTSRGDHELDECFRYHVETNIGDCGRPLVVFEGSDTGKIIGIHVAGTLDKTRDTFGVASIVDSKMISLLTDERMMAESDPTIFNNRDFKNLQAIETVPAEERVHLPNKSKLKKSLLYGKMPLESLKQPAIMSEHDERAGGKDPVTESLIDMFDHVHVPVDQDLVEAAANATLHHLRKTMAWPVEMRRLTFEEAVFGIPGKLCSINNQTSAGWPLMQFSKGKTMYFWHDEKGMPHFDPDFKQLVLQYVDNIDRCSTGGGTDEFVASHRFIGFLKDELVKQSKIDSCSTRVIYCNDLVAFTAFRILYGSLIAALNSSYDKSCLAIGINQFSYDMDKVYSYLAGHGKDVGFIAGDYKGFDKRMHPEFQRKAYQILGILGCWEIPEVMDFVYKHECKTYAQISNVRFKTVSNNMSGCFFTTGLNCLVNDMYMRYCFMRLCPGRVFDQCVRAKYLGDDHILGVVGCPSFNPLSLGEAMREIGQIYTSADKVSDLTSEYSTFDQVTFLGSIPSKINGLWCGKIKSSIANEAVQWTRDNGRTLNQTALQMCELMACHDKKTFKEFVNAIRDIEIEYGVNLLEGLASYEELRQVVPMRTAGTDNMFVGEGPLIPTHTPVVSAVPGLTDMRTSEMGDSHHLQRVGYGDMAGTSLNEIAMPLEYGPSSLMYRQDFNWDTTQAAGTIIQEITAPFGLLSEANVDNIQNMPFQRFIYFKADIEITIQVTGTPFQAGRLLAFWLPFVETNLGGYTVEDGLMVPHVKIGPNRNTTAVLRVPFRFYRNVMNTYAGALGQEEMGVFQIGVLSPLVVNNDDTTVSVSIYSRFVNSKFTIPRPPPNTFVKKNFLRGDLALSINRENVERDVVAEGGGSSKQTSDTSTTYNVSNYYGTGSVVGDVSTGGSLTGGSNTARNGAEVKTDFRYEHHI